MNCSRPKGSGDVDAVTGPCISESEVLKVKVPAERVSVVVCVCWLSVVVYRL